jgi:hypothetical protein
MPFRLLWRSQGFSSRKRFFLKKEAKTFANGARVERPTRTQRTKVFGAGVDS